MLKCSSSGEELSHWLNPKYPAVGQAWSSVSVLGIARPGPDLFVYVLYGTV